MPRTFSERNIDQLTQAVSRLAEVEGDHISGIPEFSFHSRMRPTESTHCIYNLGIGIILQGQKEVIIGDQVYPCHAGQSMLTTIDLPVTSHVIEASVHQPFLAILLLLDAQMVNEVVADMPDSTVVLSEHAHHAFTVETADEPLINAFLRLVKVLDEPAMIPHLGPLIQKEIIVRLLSGPHGIYLRQLVKSGSTSQKIQQVISWLKTNFIQPIRMDELAEKAFMSPSAFRQHFRTVTGMSPLQYQKQLRLQEARHLMFNQNLDAGRTAGMVGYESASQFSREYSRMFGESPQRDIQRMRQSL